jgi:D-aminoacyl-tRNA deacylase
MHSSLFSREGADVIALVQRVARASVEVDGRVTGRIGPGMLILLGVHESDTLKELKWLVRKCANLRIFPDDDGRMNLSLLDAGGEALVVSQFTLYGDANKGNRPSYTRSAGPDVAEPLYERFIVEMERALGREVARGEFGAMMDVSLVNDGPVTIWIEKSPETD